MYVWLRCLVLHQIIETEKKIVESELNNPTPKQPKSKIIKRVILLTVLVLVILYVSYFVTCKFFLNTVSITGHSMQHTIFDGDKVILQNNNYNPAPGDIVVVAENGTALNTAIIKRVIAVQGQTVNIDFQTGTVYVDGKALDESAYTVNGSTQNNEGVHFPQTVPENCVFILGDNRNVSEDSRNPKVGMVNKHFILGKVTMVVYPLHHIKFF